MVKSTLTALCLLACSGSAQAQNEPLDWSGAGGDMFGRSVQEASSEAGEGPPRLPSLSQPFQEEIAQAAARHGLDQKLLHALVLTESAYAPDAVSVAGAAGLTQLMPGTARELGVADRFDPAENLRGGADYLARQILRFGDLRLALAAYNAGPGRVARLGRTPDIAETQAYVDHVIECYLALTAGRRPLSRLQCGPDGRRGP
ncbi:lytic transglycosylase domain-containing protein [Phenylobacterium sp.]|uniref:lytic transglycosylase domain-containing protein n=1 Tax=Phenylobacterium sp. TaxID=1871053 RepID=UPI0030012311